MSARHAQIPELCERGLQICAWLQSPAAVRLPDLVPQYQAIALLYCLAVLDLTVDLLRELGGTQDGTQRSAGDRPLSVAQSVGLADAGPAHRDS